ncbi:MAG: TGS domain-containing protein, partial [Clostridia bacterium]
MHNITLKDGSVLEVAAGSTCMDVAKLISEGLARMALVAVLNGEVVDLSHEITEDATLELQTFDGEDGRRAFRHTASHVLAQAVKRLYPAAKLAIGPAIENGFYYDFDAEPFTTDDLTKIEAEMKKIVKENLIMERYAMPRDEALAFMREKDEPYKVELIENLPEGETISFYKQGEFIDLCAGAHVPS